MNDDGLTTQHVQRAKGGDATSVGWLVERLSPWLLVQARYRLSKGLAHLCEPEDLIQDVWMIALPKLPSLSERDGRSTPVLVRFLSTTLLYRLQDMIEKDLVRRKRQQPTGSSDSSGSWDSHELSASVTGALTRLVKREQLEQLEQAIALLDPRDRELVILRGIEQNSHREIGVLLGTSENASAVGYHRALQKLRSRLGEDLTSDLLSA